MILVYDILGYKMMIDKLKIEDDKSNQELEDSHGDPNSKKVALEKRINLSYSKVEKTVININYLYMYY